MERRKNSCKVEVLKNGPLLIQGPLSISYNGKEESPDREKIFLCRCGGSSKKPYCDGTHKKIGFEG